VAGAGLRNSLGAATVQAGSERTRVRVASPRERANAAFEDGAEPAGVVEGASSSAQVEIRFWGDLLSLSDSQNPENGPSLCSSQRAAFSVRIASRSRRKRTEIGSGLRSATRPTPGVAATRRRRSAQPLGAAAGQARGASGWGSRRQGRMRLLKTAPELGGAVGARLSRARSNRFWGD
jgi:hypothetical protein